MSIRILLADDHQLFRSGLRSLIEQESDMEIVAEAADGAQTVSLAEKHRPDVVVMDITMPDLNGVEATSQVCSLVSGVRVIALSMHSDRRYVAGMLKAGACGYLLKDCAYEELVKAIRAALAGQTYLSPTVASLVVDDYVRQPASGATRAATLLSPREREVLQLLAEGRNVKEIGGRLHVSPKTVETHRRNIMEKLDLHSLPELTKFAIREGLTTLEM
jgi:DNA-binding NarL/FixJ family response regulator